MHGYFKLLLLSQILFLFRRRARLFFNYDYYCKLLFSSGGVRGYLLLLRFLFSGGVHNYFPLLLPSRVLFCRVVCVVIFNYYYWFANCVFFRVACAVIFNHTTITSFSFRVVYAVIFQLLLLSRVLFSGWRARLFLSSISIASFVLFRVACAVLFLNTTNIFEFFFSGGVHGFLISSIITNVVCPGGVRGYF